MANTLTLLRKLNDRRDVRVKVTLPTPYDFTARTIKFYMDNKDTGAAKTNGQTAQAVDITPAGSTALTVWRFIYTPDADDFDTAGTYLAEFEVDFGGGVKHYYPIDKDLIVVVLSHPAAS